MDVKVQEWKSVWETQIGGSSPSLVSRTGGGYDREITSVLLLIIVNTRVAMVKSSPSSHRGMLGPGRYNTNNILYPTPNLQLW